VRNNWIEDINRISREAGKAILTVYQKADMEISTKADESPLTEADLLSHQTILSGLKKLTPDIPVLSEESAGISFEERRHWNEYWLVDPLDGTKEFIARNGEFTVNIALIREGRPVQGVVYVPVMDRLYSGFSEDGQYQAYREEQGKRTQIAVRHVEGPFTVVASRRHGSEEQVRLMSRLQGYFRDLTTTSMGSSLKLCLVAEGKADFYPRLAPTSEWDTAAAQAVVEAAGGKVVSQELLPLRYNSKESLLNPFFYVLGDPDYDWASLLSGVK